MNWKLKCLAFHLLNRMPSARSGHSFFQKYVTRRYFQELTPATLSTYRYHVENFCKLPLGSTALEFGAGRNLLTPLLLSAAGAKVVFAVDLDRLATVEQVNGVIDQLRVSMPGQWPALQSLDELFKLYRIDYRAPGDARNTGLPDDSVDFFCSTSTLEHIPAPEIKAILSECNRIASKQALYSFIIDYHDHYGTADHRIGRFHFYRYTDTQWRRFNPPNHYQNRLRHSDYERLFAETGLRAVANCRIVPSWAEQEFLKATVGPAFKTYSHEDLVTANGQFLLQLNSVAMATA
jgi:hypothetical protein